MKQFVVETTNDTLNIKQSVSYNIHQTIRWAMLFGLPVFIIYSYVSSLLVIVTGVLVFLFFVSPNTYLTEALLSIHRETGKLKFYHSKEILQIELFNTVELFVNEDHEELFQIRLLALSAKAEDNRQIFQGNLGCFSNDQPLEVANTIATFLNFKLITNITDED